MHVALTRYESLSPGQQHQLLDLDLSQQQIRHVGDIHGGLHTLTARPVADRQGFVLLIDEIPRGFFLLKRRTLLPDWALQQSHVTATLHALMIDRRFQGQGLGKRCLQALPELTREMWPDTQQLMLAVDAGNHAARELYRALGWQELPGHEVVNAGLERVMRLKL
jgi:ribosomal protein S18 acetylase RimI-like enzyme